MKLKYGNEVFEDEDELAEFVVANVDEDVLIDFVNDSYEGYSDNVNEWTPAEIYEGMVGSFDSLREDEDLFDYIEDYCSSGYYGFDDDDYDGTETECEIGGLTFIIEFDPVEEEEEE